MDAGFGPIFSLATTPPEELVTSQIGYCTAPAPWSFERGSPRTQHREPSGRRLKIFARNSYTVIAEKYGPVATPLQVPDSALRRQCPIAGEFSIAS